MTGAHTHAMAAGAAAALGAAVLFAVGSVLQQEVAAATTNAHGRLDLRRLLTRPAWLAGQAATVLATGLQIVALAMAPVSFVQPVLAAGLVVALVARSVRDRAAPSATALLGAACATVGLGAFLVTARPAVGAAHDLPGPAIVVLITVVAVGVVVAACRTRPGPAGALCCGLAAGFAMAVAAVLIAAALKVLADQGLAHALTTTALWGAVVTALAAELVSQQAFARGALAWSLPALTVVDPLAAVPVARLLLGEHLEAGHAAAWLPAGVVAALGVVLLARTEPARPAAPHQLTDAHGPGANLAGGQAPVSARPAAADSRAATSPPSA